jgi:TetR/AcrR family transcriptional regulator, transcriptional repressor for nem operon
MVRCNMKKGENTKQFIVEKAAEIFNQKGYSGGTLQDIMEATGLQKGGVYRHFENKDEIALEAFDFAFSIMEKRFINVLNKENTAYGKLIAIINVYTDIIENPPLIGGCPLLNTAIDSENTHPLLKEKAIKAMDKWINMIKSILSNGMTQNEFKNDIETDYIPSFIISTIEGAVMISRLYNDSKHIKYACDQLAEFVNEKIKL